MSENEYKEALIEWRAARSRFENAADADKTELAIYELLSARRKVMFLMKRNEE